MTSFLEGTKSIGRSRCSSEAEGNGIGKGNAKEVGIVMMNCGITLIEFEEIVRISK